MKKISISEICDQILVHAPYFALEKLERHEDGTLVGSFNTEHKIRQERGPVAVGELNRHLALFGACTAALTMPPSPRYYLASKVELSVLRNNHASCRGEKVGIRSKVVTQDKNSATVHCEAFADNFFARFNCKYKILSEKIFGRAFSHCRAATVAPSQQCNSAQVALDFEVPQDNGLVSHSVAVSISSFTGHFPDFPTWPASAYADAICRTVGRLLDHMLSKEHVSFDVLRFEGEAYKLLSASEPVSFHINCTSASSQLAYYSFAAQVKHGNIVVAACDLEVSL